ncbi:MAG TPA: hypothetical protein VHG28_12645 [Longimicrobiaceae bacterium]|nr:hypothetical protein [Longimicrobiaceae bacterium]
MSGKAPRDERPSQDGNLPQDPARREFLGSAAAMAAVAVGAPTLLAACDSDTGTGPESPRVAAPQAPSANVNDEPWWTLHRKIAATIGSASDVEVPTLEKANGGYLQRIITDDDRTGTGLATVLRSSYKFSTGSGTVTVTVSVQNGGGKAWPARTIYKQSDLVYAMKDALATNTLTDGVLRESLETGNPVIAIVKASVVQFHDGVASDYYGNHLQVASRAFCDIFNPYVGNVRLGSTTRDFSRS